MNHREIVLGTRGSSLALTQAAMVKRELERVEPGIVVTVRVIVTTGDKRTDVPLADVAKVSGIFDKGVFLKEIEQALENGEIDIAVHSLKDMPSELAPEFVLAAVLPRASVEDVLISKAAILPVDGYVATGSVRRRRMGETMWGPQMRFGDLRGNVPTRLSKLVENDDWDAIVLARAGLERLGLYRPSLEVDGTMLHVSVLPVDDFVPAAGQGIVAIEARKDRRDVIDLLQRINDERACLCARAEREFLKILGADCSTPVGVHATLAESGSSMELQVLLYQEGDAEPLKSRVRGDASQPERLACELHRSLFP